jgi:hypothetical protein
VSVDLANRIQLGLGELTRVREQMSPLIAKVSQPDLNVIETAALPVQCSRDLLDQMAATRHNRPAVISADLVISLDELLSFRHLYRGASIVLMRWDKLSPLVAKVIPVHAEVEKQLTQFGEFVR